VVPYIKPDLDEKESILKMEPAEPDIFWIHIEGKGVLNHVPRADVMAKYLDAFDSLVNHIAIFRGYISPANPADRFHVYYAGLRDGSAGLGMRLIKATNLAQFVKIRDPVDEVNADVSNIIKATSRRDGFKFFASSFQDSYQRLALYADIRKMCSTSNRRIWITRTGHKDPWEKSSLNISLDNNVKENLETWTSSEIDHGMPFITGYFTGFRISKSNFWILLDDGKECACEYADERIGRIVDNLRKYDKIKVVGDVVLKPGKSPEVRKVMDIVNLDVLAEKAVEGLELNAEFDDEFLRDIDEGEKDIKEGRVLSEDEFWNQVNDKPTK
jgi:hypothetical protein